MDKLIKVGKIFADVTKDLVSTCMDYLGDYTYNLVMLADQWQRAVLLQIGDVDITDMSLNDQIKNTIHVIGDSLQWISEKYREFRENVLDIPLVLSGEIDRDMNEFMVEVAKQMKKFKIFNDMLIFYMDYQSWFEEFHFTKYMEDATGDLKMYVE